MGETMVASLSWAAATALAICAVGAVSERAAVAVAGVVLGVVAERNKLQLQYLKWRARCYVRRWVARLRPVRMADAPCARSPLAPPLSWQ